MSRIRAEELARLEAHQVYQLANDLFANEDYYAAVEVLEHLIATQADETGLNAARELLTRSYFHSAQMERAVEAARDLLEREPTSGYAALLLARSLERLSRHDEAARARRLADALGAPS